MGNLVGGLGGLDSGSGLRCPAEVLSSVTLCRETETVGLGCPWLCVGMVWGVGRVGGLSLAVQGPGPGRSSTGAMAREAEASTVLPPHSLTSTLALARKEERTEGEARIWAVAFSARKLGSSRLGKG